MKLKQNSTENMLIKNVLSTFSSMRRFAETKIEREFHAYCVSPMKSGTHSIAEILCQFNSLHEEDAADMIDIVLAMKKNELSENEVNSYIIQRDYVRNLEMDSAAISVFFIKMLVNNFPESKFILTFRNCQDWLSSVINQQLNWPLKGRVHGYFNLIFGSDEFHYSPEEKILQERGLHTVDGYLTYWRDHNLSVIEAVPKERLLVIRTEDISNKLDVISKFLHIRLCDMVPENSHSFKAPKFHHVLQQIPEAFIHNKIKNICGKVINSLNSLAS